MEKQLSQTLAIFAATAIKEEKLRQLKGGGGDTNGDGIITEEDIIV